MKKIVALALLISTINTLAQEVSLKQQALEAFNKETYSKAILLLENAVEETPNDAELYYYLGFFNHYRAYDSRPLMGYDYSYSKQIFGYLDKAIERNSNYGNAKYLYGAECSGNAFLAMQNNDLESLKHFYQLAFDKGAYPKWLIEFGKNMLDTCDRDAILFAGGNADFDVCTYLQLHENYRKDISIIPIGNIDRPWYVKFLKDGLEGGFRSIDLSLTEAQVFDIHPFKWKTQSIEIPVNKNMQTQYKLGSAYKMLWNVHPDLTSDHSQSKIEDESKNKRSYLSPRRAILLQIIEDNFNKRPIYFSNLTNPAFFGGLESNFKNCGLVSELTPIHTDQTEYQYDFKKIEQVLSQNKLKYYPSIIDSDIPRISSIVYAYHEALIILAEHYAKEHNNKKLKHLKELYMDRFVIKHDIVTEKHYLDKLKSIQDQY